MNNLYQPQIDNLNSQIQRLEQLKQQSNNFIPNNQPIPQQVSQEDMIRNLIRQELNQFIPTNTKIETPVQPLTEYQQMLKQVDELANAVLSQDDIKFLNSPDMIKCFPVFLKSNKGKEAAALMLQEYRSYIEGK